MELSKQDKQAEQQAELKYSKEELADIRAAMMEELGFERKDKLPLENKKGVQGHVDLDALDRQKKANDPRTVEYRIAQENAEAHSAWKSIRFNDIDEASLGLDSMNLGQSHRVRMKAELEGLNPTRGGHAHRGSRGGQPPRGGRSFANIGRAGPGRGRRNQVPIELVMAHLRGTDVPRVGSVHGKRSGFTRGGSANIARHRAAPTPEPNLSFHDSRPINELPIKQNIDILRKYGSEKDSSVSTRDPRPIRHAKNFVLTDPAKFMTLVWPERLKGSTTDPRTRPIYDETDKKIPNTTTTITPSPVVEEQRRLGGSDDSAVINSDPAEQPLEPHSSNVSHDNRIIVHEVEVRVEKVEGQSTIVLGLGVARIIVARGACQTPDVIELEVEQKQVLRLALSEDFKLTLDSSIVLLDLSTDENSIKWILRTPLPWKAKQFIEEIDRRKSPVAVSNEDESNVQMISGMDDVQTLISFEDDEQDQQLQYPSFTEDLLSLMDDQTIDETLKAIDSEPPGPLLDQISAMLTETVPSQIDLQAPRKVILGGLATSRFAAANALVEKFMSKSWVFKSLPEETAAALTEKITKRGLEKGIHSDVSHRAMAESLAESVHNIKQRNHVKYTPEEMILFRKNACIIRNFPVSDPWISPMNQFSCSSASTGATPSAVLPSPSTEVFPRRIVHMTRSGVSIMAPGEKPAHLEGLAKSKYATRALMDAEKARASPPKAKAEASMSSAKNPPEFRGFQHSKYARNSVWNARAVKPAPKNQTGSTVQLALPYVTFAHNQTNSKSGTLIDLKPVTCQSAAPMATCSEILKSEMSEEPNKNVNTLRSEEKDTVDATSWAVKMVKSAEKANTTANLGSSVNVTNHNILSSATLAGWKNFKRRSSFSSLTSKDSSETIKPILHDDSQAPMQTVQDDMSQPVATYLRRVSELSADSDISSTSFTTANEGESPKRDNYVDKVKDTVSQGLQDKVKSEQDIVAKNTATGRKPIGIEGKSMASGTYTRASVSSVEMSDFAATLRAKGGLATSRFATDPKSGFAGNTKSATRASSVTKPSQSSGSPKKTSLRMSNPSGGYTDTRGDRSHTSRLRIRSATEIIDGHLNSGARSQSMTTKVFGDTQRVKDQTSSLSLRPTASAFTPPNTRSMGTPQGNIFRQPMAALTPTEPLMATVLVADGFGGYEEVNGILAAARVPLVAHGTFRSLRAPVNENATPGSAMTTQLSQKSTNLPFQSSLPARHLQDGSGDRDFQQEIPKRLERSLAQRKSSDPSSTSRDFWS